MSAALLDGNVLIALLDRRHIHRDQAHTWLAQSARCGPVVRSRHRFWADGLSLLEPDLVRIDRLLDPAQLTDADLLALAVHHGGHLVTLDRRLQAELVEGGREALVVLDGT